MSRPTILLIGGAVYWVIRTRDPDTLVLKDADSTPTVAIRKNGASVGDSVTIVKRAATTGIYDCEYNPAGEVEGDSYTVEESATVTGTTTAQATYANSWSFGVVASVPISTGDMEQLRHRFGIDGAATAPSTATGAKLGDVLMTQLFIDASGTNEKTGLRIRTDEGVAFEFDDIEFVNSFFWNAEEAVLNVGSIGANIVGDLTGKVIGGGVGAITGTGVQASLPANAIGIGTIAVDAIDAGAIKANALDNKGNWNIGKTGYALTTPPPTAVAVADEVQTRTIARVTLVDTTTTNTDMRGTDNAALEATLTAARDEIVEDIAAIGAGIISSPTVERIQSDTDAIRFSWPIDLVTITGQVSKSGGSYSNVVGAITQRATENGVYWYQLAYNAADRQLGSQRYQFTDGTITRFVNLLVNPVGDATYVVTIPAVEAESIVLGVEVTRYRGTKWQIAVEGLGTLPTKCYATIKRGSEPDAKAIAQVVVSDPAAGTDGLNILNGAAANTASDGSIVITSYVVSAVTYYRATLTLEAAATAAIRAGTYRLDFKDATADIVLGESALKVVNPVTLTST